MKKLLPLLALASVALTACPSAMTAPAITPDGKAITSSGKIISGTIQGSKLGPKTKVAVQGAFNDSKGAKVDANGRPISGDSEVLFSVATTLTPATTASGSAAAALPTGKYGIDMPQPPTGAVTGSFELYLYNDKNDNNKVDADEDKTKGNNGTIALAPVIGYQVGNLSAGGADAFAADKFNLIFQ